MVSGVGRGIGVLDGSGDRRREGVVLGVNLESPIVTDRDFVALCHSDALFPNYFGKTCSHCRKRFVSLSSNLSCFLSK